MSSLERRLMFSGVALIVLAFMIWAAGGHFFTARRASSQTPNYSLAYYGADISTNGGMFVATGVNQLNSRPSNGPWPQFAKNYCFLAAVQAVSNYEYWKQGYAIEFPAQDNQGPADDIASDATSGANGTPWQILYDMQTYMIPPGGPVPPPTGFTLADSSRDFGGDPRAHAYAAEYETPPQHYYHQYIYHTGVAVGTYGLAKGVAASHWDGPSPDIAIVNHALHSVVIAGVWSYGDPSAVGNATIDSFAVYNPWDQNWGAYLNGAYYARVSYSDWTTNPWWWGLTYNANNGQDPDPVIGMYTPTSIYPTHWIGNYVSIQRDEVAVDNANYSIDENGNVMLHP